MKLHLCRKTIRILINKWIPGHACDNLTELISVCSYASSSSGLKNKETPTNLCIGRIPVYPRNVGYKAEGVYFQGTYILDGVHRLRILR